MLQIYNVFVIVYIYKIKRGVAKPDHTLNPPVYDNILAQRTKYFIKNLLQKYYVFVIFCPKNI